MPSIGWSEMLMLALVAIIVVGPKELPRLMRVVGHWMGKARAAAREFQHAFDDLARESEIEEMRRKMDDWRGETMFADLEDEEEEEQNVPATSGRTAGGNGAGSPQTGRDKENQADAEASGDDEHAEEEPQHRSVPSH